MIYHPHPKQGGRINAMAISLNASGSYHVWVTPLHVRLKCDVVGCWSLGKIALEFTDAVGRPLEHRVTCSRHTDEEIEKVRAVATLPVHDERAGRQQPV